MTTSFCIAEALLGSWEILIILVVLATLAAAVLGTVLLVVFLTRRKPASPPVAAPPSIHAPATHCPRCGTPLPPGSPQGLCPRCLMGVGIATPTGPAAGIGPYGTLRVQSSGASATPRPVSEIAKLFPQLDILECLGRGGMGVVYKARQPGLDRCVALKILAGEKEADPRFAERFQREARALAKLNHPNIVTVYDFGESGGLYYLLMEFVDGVNLRDLLRSGKITPEQALTIVPPICDALQFAHRLGIIHRDIKPENILLDRDGRVKIADFGIAKMLGAGQPDSLTGELGVVGTPNYMAPEQVERPGRVDHRADIFSLGVVFYEMLTGELPLGRFAPPSQKVAVDVRLDEVVLRTLEKDPERRYQQAGEVKTELETITRVAPSGPASPAASFAPPTVAPAPIPPAATPSPAPPPAPARFSRTALIGAIWAAFAFLILPAVFIVHTASRGEDLGPAWWQTLMAFTLLPLAATAPFGSTLLGWVALAQIRRSAGRLYGLGLALFDALLFPLLALDAAIAALLVFGVARGLHQLLFGHGMNLLAQLALWLFALLAIAAIVFADVWIIRATWKAVNRPLAPSPAPTPSATTPDQPANPAEKTTPTRDPQP